MTASTTPRETTMPEPTVGPTRYEINRTLAARAEGDEGR